MKCLPLRQADTAKLWIDYGERQTAVEGSEESAARRNDHEMSHLFFSVEVSADRRPANCMRLRWRVAPWGSNPVDTADFGGKFPSGIVDLLYNEHHGETGGAIQIWVPDDRVRERPETFRIVLLDPISGAPLKGAIGIYDARTGMRARHPTPASLNMANRLVMTVLDAPEQAARR